MVLEPVDDVEQLRLAMLPVAPEVVYLGVESDLQLPQALVLGPGVSDDVLELLDLGDDGNGLSLVRFGFVDVLENLNSVALLFHA